MNNALGRTFAAILLVVCQAWIESRGQKIVGEDE
jgi:hypothetical protein